MRKVLGISLVMIIIAGGAAMLYLQKQPKEKSSTTTTTTQQTTPTSDYYYYDVVLVDGRRFVSKVNNYNDGRKELYQIFISIDGKLTPYSMYLEEQQRKSKGGGITNYQQNPTIMLSAGQISKLEKLPEDGETIKSIEAYISQSEDNLANEITGQQ